MRNTYIALAMLIMLIAPGLASTLVVTETYGCGANLDTLTLTGSGFTGFAGSDNYTNFTYNTVEFSTSNVGLTDCSTGDYINASHVNNTALGAFACNATIYTTAYEEGHLTAIDEYSVNSSTDDITVKCYEVTDLVYQGIDIAGAFMYELVQQSGNIAAVIILGLIITIIVGLIAAIGAIFYVFKVK